MQVTSNDNTPRIALFIDFDNGQLDINAHPRRPAGAGHHHP